MHNYRLYTFINFYLSSIQQGIQSAHIVSDLFVRYPSNTAASEALIYWSTEDKTIIVLNGGTTADIIQDYRTVLNACESMDKDCYLPHASFTEDPNALGVPAFDRGVVTGWGIIVPEEMWGSEYIQPDSNFTNLIGMSVDSLSKAIPPHYTYTDPTNNRTWKYAIDSPEGIIIQLIQSKGLAR